jgi:hypothetical protein
MNVDENMIVNIIFNVDENMNVKVTINANIT